MALRVNVYGIERSQVRILTDTLLLLLLLLLRKTLGKVFIYLCLASLKLRSYGAEMATINFVSAVRSIQLLCHHIARLVGRSLDAVLLKHI